MSFFPRKILLATDGSKDSALAREAAVDLANKTDSELHVVHVGLLSRWVMPYTLSDAQYERLRQEAQKILDEEAKKIQEAGGTVTDAHLRMGRADVEVVRLSQELQVGLLIIGNRGRETIARILLGSDAESIVRHAPCPVLVVREEE
jgi:universal stress protein A